MSFFGGSKSSSRGSSAPPPPLGFRSSDIAAFEKRGSEFAQNRSLNVGEAAPGEVQGGDLSRAEGEKRINRLVSLFSSRQGEVASRQRAPGRSILGN